MPCNEVFGVAETVLGEDRRVYLKLADGRGWVFDDRMLFPDDCSVVMIPPPQFSQQVAPSNPSPFAAPQGSHCSGVIAAYGMNSMPCSGPSHGSADGSYGVFPVEGPYPFLLGVDAGLQRYHTTRGCRGGAKRNKGRKAMNAQQQASGAHVTTTTSRPHNNNSNAGNDGKGAPARRRLSEAQQPGLLGSSQF